MIVFYPETSTSSSVTSTETTLTPGNVLNDDEEEEDSLTSSGANNRYGYSNINESTSLSFLYDLYQQLSILDRNFTTINGNSSNVTIGGGNSNIYVNDYLSGASGLSVNSANYYAALAAAQRNDLVGFSDMDMAAYSPY